MRLDAVLVGLVLVLGILLSVGSSAAIKKPIRLHSRGCALGAVALLLGFYLAGQPWAQAAQSSLAVAVCLGLLYLFVPRHRESRD